MRPCDHSCLALFSAIALCAGFAVRAGAADNLVVRQRTSSSVASAAAPEEQTQYWAQNRHITDSAHVRVSVDFGAKTVTFIDKDKKTYFVRGLDDVRQQSEYMRKRLESLPPQAQEAMKQLMGSGPATLRPTGKAETIAGYAAAEYAIENAGPLNGSVWITDAIEPPLAAAQREMVDLADGTPQGPAHRIAEAVAQHKGLALRTEMSSALGKQKMTTTSEVVEVREQSPPPDMLRVPPGFKEVEAPKIH